MKNRTGTEKKRGGSSDMKYFLNPMDTDVLTQLALQLKGQLSQTLFYAEREKIEGDSLWTSLVSSWYGALVTSADVKLMQLRMYPQQADEAEAESISEIQGL